MRAGAEQVRSQRRHTFWGERAAFDLHFTFGLIQRDKPNRDLAYRLPANVNTPKTRPKKGSQRGDVWISVPGAVVAKVERGKPDRGSPEGLAPFCVLAYAKARSRQGNRHAQDVCVEGATVGPPGRKEAPQKMGNKNAAPAEAVALQQPRLGPVRGLKQLELLCWFVF